MNKIDELLQPRKLEGWEKYDADTRRRLSGVNDEINARAINAHAGLKKRIDVEAKRRPFEHNHNIRTSIVNWTHEEFQAKAGLHKKPFQAAEKVLWNFMQK